MATPLENAADAIEAFTDALIGTEVSNIEAIVIAATPAIVAHALQERKIQDAR